MQCNFYIFNCSRPMAEKYKKLLSFQLSFKRLLTPNLLSHCIVTCRFLDVTQENSLACLFAFLGSSVFVYEYYFSEWYSVIPQGNQELLSVSGQRQSWKTPRWAWAKQVHGMWYFFLQCFNINTVGWVTGRASGL